MTGKTVPPWQHRRSQFNHDWLKNQFLNNLDGFLVMLRYREPNREHLAEFLENDFFSWPQRFNDGKRLIDSFENEMTPARLFNETPLKKTDPGTRQWLSRLIHSLWLCRYRVQETIINLSDLFEKAVAIHETIGARLTGTGMGLEELKPLLPEFTQFRALCFQFSGSLGTLPHEVKYT